MFAVSVVGLQGAKLFDLLSEVAGRNLAANYIISHTSIIKSMMIALSTDANSRERAWNG